MWDPALYGRFGAERSRPFFDLVAQIGARYPRAVADLGCGPGDLTRTLAERWPLARVTGIDNSPEMIGKATAQGGPVGFELGGIADWHPEPDVDVIVTNAALQWVPEHRELLVRWAGELISGAWIAMQVPGNFDSPGHRALRDLAGEAPYADRLAGVVRANPVDDPEDYAALLTAAGATVNAWETTYLHLLPDDGPDHPVLRWMEGTALRPVRAALDDEAWTAFRAELGERIAATHTAGDGLVALPFRRIFVVARVS
ncbi:trans-aconitate 2-methyltransferase [Actinoplanes rectilineatus]|uniref:trans-aconitate 2-methyltransferase n=1 Tax=Actinoplanes rectilineatus TaxID=113571 RepID=UPI0005F2DC4C|nr:trans-aconitate 2-methyltransferase [Actinoplanes rectilineatus]